MLKIKDNVNLKKLEKFGIKFQNDFKGGYYYCNRDFKISTKKHHLIPLNGTGNTRFDRLYDLIQAGLIEKVEE